MEAVNRDKPAKPTKYAKKVTQAHKDKMVALRTTNHMTEEQIAKQLDLTRDTVHYHLSRLIDKAALQDFTQNEPDIIAWKKYKIINHLTDEKLKEAKARDLTVSYGILDDHERLQRGLATEIHDVQIRALVASIPDKVDDAIDI